MIQIKDKVNKTQLFKELTEIGKKRFEFTCEPKEDLKVFLDGAEALFKLLLLPVVSCSFNLEVKDMDIATIEAMHDTLLDEKVLGLNARSMKESRALTQRMYKALGKD